MVLSVLGRTRGRGSVLKKVGGLKREAFPSEWVDIRDGAKILSQKLISVRRGETRHRRESLRVPGDLVDHMDSSAHHLALAVCGHIPSPCTECLAWADLCVYGLIAEKTFIDEREGGGRALATVAKFTRDKNATI